MGTTIGLTGGIASGKSVVSGYLEERGYTVWDTDLIAREVVEPGTPGLQAIVNAFGKKILQGNGQLNRAALGEIVFSDEEARQKLNALLHPMIREVLKTRLAASDGALVFLVVPLLYEAGYEDLCDEIWLVTAPEETRLERLMSRDALSEGAAVRRLRTQMADSEKRRRGPYILENNSTPDNLLRQVDTLLEERSTQ